MIVDRPSLERLAKEDFGAVNLFDDAGDADALEALVDRGRVVPHHPAHLVRHHEVADLFMFNELNLERPEIERRFKSN